MSRSVRNQKVIKVRRSLVMKDAKGKSCDFKLDTLTNREPMKLAQDGLDMISTSKGREHRTSK